MISAILIFATHTLFGVSCLTDWIRGRIPSWLYEAKIYGNREKYVKKDTYQHSGGV